jgi:hypothetical protein
MTRYPRVQKQREEQKVINWWPGWEKIISTLVVVMTGHKLNQKHSVLIFIPAGKCLGSSDDRTD